MSWTVNIYEVVDVFLCKKEEVYSVIDKQIYVIACILKIKRHAINKPRRTIEDKASKQ